MNKYRYRITGSILILTFSLLLTACHKASAGTSNAELYGPTIAQLADDEAFAIIDAGAGQPILLASNQLLEEGEGDQASVFCDVYYAVDGEVQKAGSIDDPALSLPLAYDDTGIYAASEDQIRRFVINEQDGFLYAAESIYADVDENGQKTWQKAVDETMEEASEEEVQALMEKLEKAAVIHFHYGASDDY